MKMTGSHLIAQALRAEGVEKMFALAGDHTLHLMDVLAGEGFQFVDTRHEQAAVDMANAWGRITGSPGVSMFTSPGHANAIPGLTLAYHMESPVINISGSAAQSRLGHGISPQELDQLGMAKPVTKGAWFVSDPHRIPDYFARAFRTALAGRRGPVHLTIPVDVQAAEVDENRVRFFPPETYRHTGQVQGDPGLVSEAIAMLRSARCPMVVAGNGAYSVEREDLQRFLEVTHLPVFTEEAARGIVPDTHPCCFGFADERANVVGRCLRAADAVLFLGKKLDFTVSYGEPPTFAPEARMIQVESSPDLVGLPRGVDISILGDIGAVVKQLAQEAEGHRWSANPMQGELESTFRTQEQNLESLAKSVPLHAMSVHKSLRPLLDDNACLIFEGCDFSFYGTPYYPSLRPNRWFTNGTLGMIGWGVPYGVGAQTALPGSRVVVLTGDGAFGFNGMELDTAVRHNLPIVIVVGNDSVWGIDYHQQVQLFGKSVATELLPSRYDKIAEALGAHGEYVEKADQLIPAFERAFASGKPALVNVRIKPTPSPLTEYIIEQKIAFK